MYPGNHEAQPSQETKKKECVGTNSGRTNVTYETRTNKLRIFPSKNENFQMKNSSSFHIAALNIDCGTR